MKLSGIDSGEENVHNDFEYTNDNEHKILKWIVNGQGMYYGRTVIYNATDC